MLPGEKKTKEVARGHRLDLGSQTLDRVMVDARQKPALAPFVVCRIRREAPAHGEAFGFKTRERHSDLVRGQPQRRRQCGRSDRPQTFKAAANDLDEGIVARPFARFFR